MKIFHLFLALLFISSSFIIASPADVNLFVYSYLLDNETFTKTPFNLSDGEYYIVNIPEPSFIVSASDGKVRMLTEKQEIQNALVGYYATLGITQEDLKVEQEYKNELLKLVDLYNATREKEYECRAYIGIDRFECVDYETCWRACYTPVCQQMKIGAGRKFLDLIWDFSNLTNSIDSNLSAFKQKLSSLSQLTSLDELDELLKLIRNMKNNSVAINNNEIFNPMAMGFCHLVSYNLTYLTEAEIGVLTKRDRVEPLLTLQETVDELHNRTLQRIQLKAQLVIDKLCSSLTANNSEQVRLFKLDTLNTSKMNQIIASLEEAGKLAGCNSMNETQIQAAQLSFLSLLNESRKYKEELGEVVNLKEEVKSSLSRMQGDFLLYFKLGEFNSKMNEIEMKIDFAESGQLPSIKSQLVQLKREMEEASGNKPISFLVGFLSSPIFLICVVLVVIYIIYKKR